MRYYFDTEFIERGHEHPIELISIGIVDQYGRTFYAENGEADLLNAPDWIKQNVVPKLSDGAAMMSRTELRDAILRFIPPRRGMDAYEVPEFWGYFADYDWVLFCQLFGTMMGMPRGYPHLCLDVMQTAVMFGVPKGQFPKQDPATEHNSLADAVWTKQVHERILNSTLPLRR